MDVWGTVGGSDLDVGSAGDGGNLGVGVSRSGSDLDVGSTGGGGNLGVGVSRSGVGCTGGGGDRSEGTVAPCCDTQIILPVGTREVSL